MVGYVGITHCCGEIHSIPNRDRHNSSPQSSIRAIDIKLNREVAIKVRPEAFTSDAAWRDSNGTRRLSLGRGFIGSCFRRGGCLLDEPHLLPAVDCESGYSRRREHLSFDHCRSMVKNDDGQSTRLELHQARALGPELFG